MAKHQFKRMWNSLVPVNETDIAALAEYPLGSIFTITLPKKLKPEDKEQSRRAAQNSLMWAWLTDLEKTKSNTIAGSTVHEWHRQFRKEYLFPIYVRDNESWASVAANLDIIKQYGTHENYEESWARILDDDGRFRLSTADATIKQFTEYLECIQRFAHSHGAFLRTDMDVVKEAFGR